MAYTPYNPYINPYYQVPNNQQMQQPMLPTQMSGTPQQNNQGLIWVSGEVGAKSYLVAPNSTVMLMDSESESFFIKSTDNAGMPTIRTFDYKERVQNVPQNAPQGAQTDSKSLSEQFVTREEYEALLGKYEDIEKQLKSANKSTSKGKKVEVEDNE